MKDSKNYWGIIGFQLLYAVIVFITAFLGFLHPALWAGLPVLAAFTGAFAYYKTASNLDSFGAGTLCAFFFCIILMALGEMKMSNATIMMIAGIVSDVVRQFIGNKTLKGVAYAYPVLALGVISWIIPLWTQTEWYHEGAIKEMGADYANGLMTFSSTFGLCAVIILTLIVAYLSIRLFAKTIKSELQ